MFQQWDPQFEGYCFLIAMSNPHFDRYRLVLVAPSARRLFIEQSQGGMRLPRISIPRWTRAAEQIQAAIELRWRFKVAVIDFLDYKSRVEGIVIAELRGGDRRHWLSYPYAWGDLSDFSGFELHDLERATVERLLHDGATDRGAFSRFGWIEDALDWVSAEAGVDRTDFTEDVSQFNASANFALARFGRRTAPPVWFKAVQDPSLPEYTITTTLSKLFPHYLPTLLASREDWNAWCTEDSGPSLEIVRSPELFNQAVSRLAELQKASIDRVPSLLECGCVDQRTSVLRAKIPEMMETIDEAMAQPNFHHATRLAKSRIREIGSIIEEACMNLESLGIPDTLLHGDFSFANILVGTRGCVFTDWAHAAIGNPFVNFEQFRGQVAQETDTVASVAHLTEIYRKNWCDVLTDGQIQCALTLVPPIAVALDLIGRWNWIGPECRREPQFQSYIRGLARQMDRATQPAVLGAVRCA